MAERLTFDNPPVDEVVLGRMFLPRQDFLVPHFGVFWERIRRDFPLVEQAMPVFNPGEPTQLPFGLIPRVWYQSPDRSQMVQLQQGRLYFNWRRLPDRSNPYVRFDAIQQGLRSAWKEFLQVITEISSVHVQITGGELTYVNYVELEGKSSIEAAELGLKDFAWSDAPRFLKRPKQMMRNWTFDMPDGLGDLSVLLQSVKNQATGTDALKLELTARGAVQNDAAFDDWAAKAHEFLVLGFKDLTTEKLHEFWKLRSN